MSGVDWEALGRELGEGILESLEGLVDGAEADIRAWGTTIGSALARALRDGETELRDELLEQLLVVAELWRVRAVNQAREAWKRVLRTAVGIAARVLAAAGGTA